MPTIHIETRIRAPKQRVFDLSRSIDVHMDSQAHHGERAIGGKTKGLIGLGEEVTWSAWHLGFRQKLTSRITAFSSPDYFRDSMVRGRFTRFDHDHYFEEAEDHTLMIDDFDYTAPLGPVGRLVDRLFLESYMTRLLKERCQLIKEVAESEKWRRYLV